MPPRRVGGQPLHPIYALATPVRRLLALVYRDRSQLAVREPRTPHAVLPAEGGSRGDGAGDEDRETWLGSPTFRSVRSRKATTGIISANTNEALWQKEDKKSWSETERMPHTEQYHQSERFTRMDSSTLKYKVTIDGPGVSTAPWTGNLPPKPS